MQEIDTGGRYAVVVHFMQTFAGKSSERYLEYGTVSIATAFEEDPQAIDLCVGDSENSPFPTPKAQSVWFNVLKLQLGCKTAIIPLQFI